MASVYKRTRDRQKKRSCWYFSFTDETGRRRTEKGFTDKGLTEQAAAKREHEVMLRKRGLIDPQQVTMAAHKNGPIEPHLKAFEKSIAPNTEKHVGLTMSRIRKIVDGCGFQTLGAIEEEPIEGFLVECQAEEGFGHRTYNHYIQAIDELCRWCVKTKRLPSNPLAGMRRLNAETDIRRRRRALSQTEFGRLLQSARDSGVTIQRYDGETRARIYTISYMTGLRRKEVGSLRPWSFQFDAEPPTVTVEATYSKHRKEDVIPLHPDLVKLLQEWLVGLEPSEFLFPKLGKRRTWWMIKKDLERAGIPYKDQQGRVADFHAAGRHTHITELLRSGATVPEAQQLARHSDVKMTMRYAHIGIEDQAKALSNLPSPMAAPIPAVPTLDQKSAGEAEWQRPGSASSVCDRHSASGAVSEHRVTAKEQKRQNPCKGKGFVAEDQSLSSDDTSADLWRER